jgi:hypothetical protein
MSFFNKSLATSSPSGQKNYSVKLECFRAHLRKRSRLSDTIAYLNLHGFMLIYGWKVNHLPKEERQPITSFRLYNLQKEMELEDRWRQIDTAKVLAESFKL